MKLRKVAVIIFYDKEGRILLQNRKGINKFGVEWDWGFFGGGIEENETPKQALVREIKEELDFDLKEFRYLGEYKGKASEDVALILHVFVSPLGENMKRFRQKEGIGMKMFPIQDAENLKIPEHAKVIIRDLNKIFN